MGIDSPKFETKPETSREKIESIENAPLDIQEKVDILLILKDLKPASDISLYSEEWPEGEKEKEINPESIEKTEELLKKNNLLYEPFEEKVADWYKDEKGQKVRKEKTFIIAKNEENLNLIKKAFETGDEKLFGKAYGFPQTSIEAYLGKGEAIDSNKLPEEIKQQDALAFSKFKLSKDNWQEELKTAQKWADAVKETSPKAYNEFMEMMKDVIKKGNL
jgi:hypothetical protein